MKWEKQRDASKWGLQCLLESWARRNGRTNTLEVKRHVFKSLVYHVSLLTTKLYKQLFIRQFHKKVSQTASNFFKSTPPPISFSLTNITHCESSSQSVNHHILSNLPKYLSNPPTSPHICYATTLVHTIISHLQLHKNLLTHLFHSYLLQSVLHTGATMTFSKKCLIMLLLYLALVCYSKKLKVSHHK